MNKILRIKPVSYLFLGIILAVIAAIFSNYSLFISIAILIYIGERKWGEATFLFLSIFLYLTFISDIIHSVRVYIQILGFILLGYIFIKRYGFNFKSYPHLPKIFLGFILLFYFSMFISSIFSKYFIAGIEEIIKQSIFFLIIFMIYAFLDRMKFIRTVLYALIFATIIVTVSILYEYIQNGFNFINYVQDTQIRLTGILTNVNAAGSYFGAIFPVSIVSISFFKDKRFKIPAIVLNVLLLLGVIITTSRSAYLSIIISILFISFMLNKKLFFKIILSVVIIILMIILIPQLNEFFSLFFRIESGISQRDQLWQLSFNMVKEHPLFGIGPGAYSYEMLNYLPVLLNSWVGQQFVILRDVTFGANNSHNFFLFFTTDMGVLGLLTSLVFPIVFLKIGFDTLKKYAGKNDKLYIFTVGLVAAGLGLFFRGIFEGIGLLTYGWITMDLPFWIIYTILISLNVNDFKTVEIFNQKTVAI